MSWNSADNHSTEMDTARIDRRENWVGKNSIIYLSEAGFGGPEYSEQSSVRKLPGKQVCTPFHVLITPNKKGCPLELIASSPGTQ